MLQLASRTADDDLMNAPTHVRVSTSAPRGKRAAGSEKEGLAVQAGRPTHPLSPRPRASGRTPQSPQGDPSRRARWTSGRAKGRLLATVAGAAARAVRLPGAPAAWGGWAWQ